MDNTVQSEAVSTAERLIQKLKEKGIAFDAPCAYRIKNTKPEQFKFLLDAKGISYREMKHSSTILIDVKDYMQCLKIDEANKTKGCFVQEYVSGDLEKIIQNMPAIQNKNMCVVDMPQKSAQAFVNRLGQIKKGLLIERTDYDNDTTRIAIPDGLLTDSEKDKVANAYLESFVVANGINSYIRDADSEELTSDDYNFSVNEYRFAQALGAYVSAEMEYNHVQLSEFKNYLEESLQALCESISALNHNDFDNTVVPEEIKATVVLCYSNMPELTYDYCEYSLKKLLDKDEDKQLQTENLEADNRTDIEQSKSSFKEATKEEKSDKEESR